MRIKTNGTTCLVLEPTDADLSAARATLNQIGMGLEYIVGTSDNQGNAGTYRLYGDPATFSRAVGELAKLAAEGELASRVSRQQIIDLRREAKGAGDYEQADLCGLALAGDEDALQRCEQAIRNGRG